MRPSLTITGSKGLLEDNVNHKPLHMIKSYPQPEFGNYETTHKIFLEYPFLHALELYCIKESRSSNIDYHHDLIGQIYTSSSLTWSYFYVDVSYYQKI